MHVSAVSADSARMATVKRRMTSEVVGGSASERIAAVGGAASPSTKPSAEEVRSATQPNAFSLLFNGCVACGVRATVQLRSAHIRTLEVMAALKRENGTLQARVAELEKTSRGHQRMVSTHAAHTPLASRLLLTHSALP